MDLQVRRVSRARPRRPVLVEGLPGIGNIGLITVDYLIDRLGARPLAELYSRHFPPVAILNDDSTATLPSNELYLHRRPGGDLLLLRGDTQAISPEGQHAVASAIVDASSALGVRRVVTVGGFFSEAAEMRGGQRVIVATSSAAERRLLASGGLRGRVAFQSDLGGGTIIGANGLILGFARRCGMEGLAIMVQTLQRDEFGFDLEASVLAIDAVTRLLRLPRARRLARDIERISEEIDASPLGPRHSILRGLARAAREDDFYVR